jgi:hypothetical protein
MQAAFNIHAVDTDESINYDMETGAAFPFTKNSRSCYISVVVGGVLNQAYIKPRQTFEVGDLRPINIHEQLLTLIIVLSRPSRRS